MARRGRPAKDVAPCDRPEHADERPGGAVPPGPLLVVDADPVTRARLAREMTAHGYDVATAATCAEAVAAIARHPPAFAILEYRLSDASGLDLVPDLLVARPAVRIVVLSRYASLRGAVAALRLGAGDFLARPVRSGEIDAILRERPPAERLEYAPVPSIADVDRRHAEAMLRAMGANLPATARALGVETRTLQRRLARSPGRIDAST